MRRNFAALAAIAALTLPALPVAAAVDPCLNPPEGRILSCLKPGGDLSSEPTRGIRLGSPGLAPHGAPASSAGPGSAPEPPARPTTPGRVDLSLQFASGSAVPTARARLRLDAIGRQLSRPELSGLHFRVEGHTDTTGSADLNKTLSQRRAEAVVAYLTGTFHLQPDRLDAVGKGQEDLPVSTDEGVAEPRNRVVRIVALGS